MITIAMEAMKEEETKEETPGRPQNTEEVLLKHFPSVFLDALFISHLY